MNPSPLCTYDREESRACLQIFTDTLAFQRLSSRKPALIAPALHSSSALRLPSFHRHCSVLPMSLCPVSLLGLVTPRRKGLCLLEFSPVRPGLTTRTVRKRTVLVSVPFKTGCLASLSETHFLSHSPPRLLSANPARLPQASRTAARSGCHELWFTLRSGEQEDVCLCRCP